MKQKAFRLKQDVTVFADEAQKRPIYRIRGDRVMGSVRLLLSTPEGSRIGTIQRQWAASLWRATYKIFDRDDQQLGVIREVNPWIKIVHGLLGELPLIGIFVAMRVRLSIGSPPTSRTVSASTRPVIRKVAVGTSPRERRRSSHAPKRFTQRSSSTGRRTVRNPFGLGVLPNPRTTDSVARSGFEPLKSVQRIPLSSLLFGSSADSRVDHRPRSSRFYSRATRSSVMGSRLP